jgi:hypothetical protein
MGSALFFAPAESRRRRSACLLQIAGRALTAAQQIKATIRKSRD